MTDTKNSASKVIRVTINSSLRPKKSDPSCVLLLPTAARGLIEPDEIYKLGFGVRWATPGRLIARAFFGGGVCERRLGESRLIFTPADADAANMVGIRILKANLNSGPFKSEPQERGRDPTE
jgi:hypothetical protein